MEAYFVGALALGMALAAGPGAAQAAVIDQDTFYVKDPANAYTFSGVGGINTTTQSFTAGVTGRLVALDLQLSSFRALDLRVQLGKGEAIVAGFAPFYTLDVPNATIPASGSEPLLSLDLAAAGIRLKAGQQYSITLSSTAWGGPSGFGWVIGEVLPDGSSLTNAPYEGGRAFASLDQGVTWSFRGVDRTFRTWMEPGAVPEPTSWALLIAGFGVVGAAARRRRTGAQRLS